jgi:fructose-1,6-bisphosphatase I
MYECNPVSFIIEQAGGKASNGEKRIMDIRPESLHQRVSIFAGSEEDVTIAEEFVQGKRGLD